MTKMIPSIGRDQGFTLIEVLVALCIFGMAIYIATDIISSSSNSALRDYDIDRALVVGRNELARVGLDIPLVDGNLHGTTAGGFEWQIDIANLEDDGSFDPINERLKLVRTAVIWRQSGGRHEVSFVTILATRGHDR